MSCGIRIRVVAAAVASLLCGVLCSSGGPAVGSAAADSVGVREFRGERLGSTADFRENSIRGPQEMDSASYRLVVDGLVKVPLSLTLEQALGFELHRKVVTLHCVEGWSVKALWEGIGIGELLDSARVLESARTVVFHAADRYTTSLPLEVVRDRDLILAHRMNDIVLPKERGYPFQLVAEDRWGYKWIKWVTRFELSADTAYRGFWEQRGYNNDGSVDGPIREPGYSR